MLRLADAARVRHDHGGLAAAAGGNTPVPGSGRVAALCDHESVPRGTASKNKTRYAVRLTVPRRSGWRAWVAVRPDFERALADPGDPGIASAEITSELRRGADYVRVTIALAVAWAAFRSAAGSDPTGWEVPAAAADVRPEPTIHTSQQSH
jgi:hypothetical protein